MIGDFISLCGAEIYVPFTHAVIYWFANLLPEFMTFSTRVFLVIVALILLILPWVLSGLAILFDLVSQWRAEQYYNRIMLRRQNSTRAPLPPRLLRELLRRLMARDGVVHIVETISMRLRQPISMWSVWLVVGVYVVFIETVW